MYIYKLNVSIFTLLQRTFLDCRNSTSSLWKLNHPKIDYLYVIFRIYFVCVYGVQEWKNGPDQHKWIWFRFIQSYCVHYIWEFVCECEL